MIYSYEECIKRFGSKYLVKKAVESESIFQLEKGIYSDERYVPEKNILAMKYPKAIFTLNTAFYLYNLTDVIPDKYYMATDRNAAKISDKRIIQIFEQSEILPLGVIKEQVNGCTINIYSKERLLVELLRHKNSLPFDYYKEILLNFREIVYDLDIRAIQDYAEAVPKSSMVLETLRLEVL